MNDLTEMVAEHLAGHGITVLDRDWQDPQEAHHLDLVAEQNGVIIVVVIRPASALTKFSDARVRLLRRALSRWMQAHGRRSDRISVIAANVKGRAVDTLEVMG